MNGLARAGRAASMVLGIALFAAMLTLAAGVSHAQRGGGHASGGGARSGGSPAYSGGGGRAYGGGGSRAWSGGGGRVYGGGGRAYAGGRVYGGVGHYGGYRRYGGGGYRAIRPHGYVSFGIGPGYPYYDYSPPGYVYYAEPYPVVVEPGTQADVTNEPPAGCYYYDRFCDQRFSTLDEYTDHLARERHAQTIEVVDGDSGDAVRTLLFAHGYWSVRN